MNIYSVAVFFFFFVLFVFAVVVVVVVVIVVLGRVNPLQEGGREVITWRYPIV